MAHAQTLKTKELSFSLSPRTMQMLGRENVSSPVIALLELVKNAYDADATTVTVTMRRASTSKGVIVVEDDGAGMSLDDVANKWMRISTDNKLQSATTGKFHRIKVGEKGIGRLSLDRLATTCDLVTHTSQESGLHLHIDWTKYETTEGELDEITHPYQEIPKARNGKSGTVMYLTGLRDRWTRDDYEILYTDLALLIPPSTHRQQDKFSVVLDCDEAPDITGSIQSLITKAAEYRLESHLTSDGRVMHRLKRRAGATATYDRSWVDATNTPEGSLPLCGPIQFILYWYLRDKETLKEVGIKLTELNKFLDAFQGVRIYRDGVRVKPYGDPLTKEDWLGLNLRRVQHPGGVGSSKSGTWFVAGNQVIGTIHITRKDNPDLSDQTNREGLAYNRAYLDLRRFVLNGVSFLESERVRELRKSQTSTRNRDSQTTIETIREEAQNSTRELSQAAQDLDQNLFGQKQAKAIQQTIARSEAIVRATEVLEAERAEDLTEKQLMIGLATLGIAMAAFGHETVPAITTILNKATLLEDEIVHLPSQEMQERARNSLTKLILAARRVEAWGQFALDRVRNDKRKRTNIDINQTIQTVLTAFEGTFNRRGINPIQNLQEHLPPLRAFPMDIEAIMINFITNSVEALRGTEERAISIGTQYQPDSRQFQIVFADSGKGIHKQDIPKIFDPMFTTRADEGTGLGLTIVKNIVDEYGGTIQVNGHSKMGGAEFTLTIPRRFARED